MKYTFLFLCLIVLVACQTKSKTDYVQLVIPEELKTNKEVVEKLEDDAKQLNRIFNSIEDFYQEIIALEDVLNALDDSTSTEELKQSLDKWAKELVKTQQRFAINVLWFFAKDLKPEETQEILNGLTEGQTVQYNKCIAHLDLKRDVIKDKVEELSEGFERLLKAFEEKEAILEKLSEEENPPDQQT